MAIFFTADTHFWHANIIKFCDRPFVTVEQMNKKLVENWNSVVGTEDTVYHLGDFANKCNAFAAAGIRGQLNGIIHLIRGNHEKPALDAQNKFPGTFSSVRDYSEIEVEGQKIMLFHYAQRVWHHDFRGAWQLYGHSHGRLEDRPYGKSCDVGVDSWCFTPVAFHALKKHLDRRKSLAVI